MMMIPTLPPLSSLTFESSLALLNSSLSALPVRGHLPSLSSTDWVSLSEHSVLFDGCEQIECDTTSLHCQSANPGPPCCSHFLFVLASFLATACSALDLGCFLMYGALLGAVRTGEVPAWTADVDLAAREGEVAVLLDPRVTEVARAAGLHIFADACCSPWLARFCFARGHGEAAKYRTARPLVKGEERFQNRFPFGDLYTMAPAPSNDTVYQIRGDVCNWPRAAIEPLSTTTLSSKPFLAPADPRYVLRGLYGEDYMTPKPARAQAGEDYYCEDPELYQGPPPRPPSTAAQQLPAGRRHGLSDLVNLEGVVTILGFIAILFIILFRRSKRATTLRGDPHASETEKETLMGLVREIIY
jgi:hypothetical protein